MSPRPMRSIKSGATLETAAFYLGEASLKTDGRKADKITTNY